MVIEGSVQTIIFRSEESGYTVIDFATESRSVTVVGCMPEIGEGEYLRFEGKWVTNSRYGEQFKAENVSFVAPTDPESIVQYLSGGLFEGVGELTARNIVSKFGAATLDIIEKAPVRLTEVTGIGKLRALSIAESYRRNSSLKNVMLFLQGHSVPLKLAVKIYEKYGEDTERLITENPYRLASEIDGIGFYKADKIAEKLGLDRGSEFRLAAGISEALSEAGRQGGHTALEENALIGRASELLGCDKDPVADLLPRLVIRGEIGMYTAASETENVRYYALNVNLNSEKSIAARLMKLIGGVENAEDVSAEIDVFERTFDIYLDSDQRAAVQTALNAGVSVITGGPGTGKTTIIRCILELAAAKGMTCLLSAPTGRAAKRLTEATGEEAKTVHRMLGLDMSSGKPTYKFNESKPLKADVVVVDEISMADVYVFSALLKAIPEGAKLILVGDKDQLPSVSPGNILADVIASGLIPVSTLNNIHRQEAGSLIVVNAHRINNGEMPIIRNDSKDFFFETKSRPEDILQAVVSLVTERLPKYFHVEPSQIQVLAPLKRSPAGVEALNVALRDALNPDGETAGAGNDFRVGDKVMHTVNDYELEWRRGSESGTGVFNGDLGYIVNVVRGVTSVEFEDGRVADYDADLRDDLMLAYAVSVHKSQGSEFPIVVIALTPGGGALLNRNLLYTAVTRAKNAVVLVGTETTLKRMVDNKNVQKRYTLLKEFLWDAAKKAKLLNS